MIVLNDFNNHRNNINKRIPNILNEEDNIDILNNNIQFNDTTKTNQINLSNNYHKELNEYLNNENKINNKLLNNNVNNNLVSNNNTNNYNKEINSIRHEIILLKSQISENELVINQYKKTINSLNTKYTEEINNFRNQINILNNYILLIYEFFNNISRNFVPQLNFYYNANENNFFLIDIKEFEEKLNIIEQYIYSINNNINNINNEENINTNENKDQIQNNDNINNINEEIINTNINNNEEIKDEIDNKNNIEEGKFKLNDNNFNNQFNHINLPLNYSPNSNLLINNNYDIVEQLPDNTYNNINYSNNEEDNNNNMGLIQLYKNLEKKFDMLEKEIEEGKRYKYECLNEVDNNLNKNINLTDMNNNNFEYQKQYFLESLYKDKKSKKNKSAKKNNKNNNNNDYWSTKVTQRNMKEKINNYNYNNISDNNRNKTPSYIRKNTKKKK